MNDAKTSATTSTSATASASAGSSARGQAPAAAAADSPEALLRELEWTVLRRLDGVLHGDHRTLWRGAGVDLADLREYQLHDDVRHIDWNVTARLQQPYVRQFQEDRDLDAWFLLDLSASVDFGHGQQTKLGVAEGLVAALARTITRHGNRVGALFYGAGPRRLLPPGGSRSQVLSLLQALRQPRPQPRPGGRTALAELLQGAEKAISRRGVVFVVSDFISEPGWQAPLARLARRHDVLAVRLFDPLESSLGSPQDAAAGRLNWITLEDAESGERLQVDAGDAGFLARYEALAGAEEQRLRRALADAGVDTLELSTTDDLLQALLRLAALRRQRARMRAPMRLPRALTRLQTHDRKEEDR